MTWLALLVIAVATGLWWALRPDRTPYGQLKEVGSRRMRALRRQYPQFGRFSTFYFRMGDQDILLCMPKNKLCYRKRSLVRGFDGMGYQWSSCPVEEWPELLLTLLERWGEIEQRAANEVQRAEEHKARQKQERDAQDQRMLKALEP